MLYIHPDECVDCGACEAVCPVEAIYYEDDVPEQWHDYIQANIDFFENLGSPGGGSRIGPQTFDAPLVAKPRALSTREYTGILREFAGLVPSQSGTVALVSPAGTRANDMIDMLLFFYDRILIFQPRDKNYPNLSDRHAALLEAGVVDVADIDAWCAQLSDSLLRLWRHLSNLDPASAAGLPSYQPNIEVIKLFTRLKVSAENIGVKFSREQWMQPITSAMELLFPQLIRAHSEQGALQIEPVTCDKVFTHALRSIAAPMVSDEVVIWDFEPVIPNVSKVPTNEILAFRTEYGHYFKRHLDLMRSCMSEVEASAGIINWASWATGRDEIAESSHVLRMITRPFMSASSGTWGLGAIGDLMRPGQPSDDRASIGRRALAASGALKEGSSPEVFTFVFSAPQGYSD
jgi:ferredoxin